MFKEQMEKFLLYTTENWWRKDQARVYFVLNQ